MGAGLDAPPGVILSSPYRRAVDTAELALEASGCRDVLMGVLAALLARGVPAIAALGWAVALHGRAGEIIERSTPVGYLARDLVRHIPAAFVELDAT